MCGMQSSYNNFFSHQVTFTYMSEISCEVNFDLFFCMTDHKESTDILSEIFLTLSRLAVRDEFCRQVLDVGGIGNILTILKINIQNQVGFVLESFIDIKYHRIFHFL